MTDQDKESSNIPAAPTNGDNDDSSQDNNNNDNDDDDIWGSSQGYTPLAAWAQAGGGNGLFSMGPSGMDSDNSNDDDDNNNGTFFANGQAFTVAAAAPDVEHDYPASSLPTHHCDQQQQSQQQPPSPPSEQDNFRSLADQALLALEDDYRLTLRGETSTFNNTAATAAVVATAEVLPASFAADFDAAQEQKQQMAASTGLMAQLQNDNNGNADDDEDDDDKDNNTPLFQADFDNPPAVAAAAATTKPLPNIDTDKVRSAVQQLKLRPNFQQEMDQWARQQQRQAAVAPLHHAYIPPAVCRTFRQVATTTDQDALLATQQLSRAATLVHALHRLDIFNTTATSSNNNNDVVVVHILGSDGIVEASSHDALKQSLGQPLMEWMMQPTVRKLPRRLELHLIGPDVPMDLSSSSSNNGVMEMMTDQKARPLDCRLESIQLVCHTGYYHEWRQQPQTQALSLPDLLIAFHPGFWGYDTWKPTLEWLVQQQQQKPSAKTVSLVATSYTLLEAEDDEQVLQDCLSESATQIWACEYNPFASHQVRPTATAVQGEEYRENAAWQAWRI